MFRGASLSPLLAQATTARVHQWFSGLPGWAQTVLVGLVTFVVAYLVVKVVTGALGAGMRRARRIDETLRVFLSSVITVVGWVVIVMATLVGFGVSPATVAGLVAAGAFIIGFALKDTLGNLAAGVVILLNKPYRVGEAVQLKGHDGTVVRLGVAMTELKTWDGRHVSVPNGAVLSDAILNWTRNPTRRLDIRAGISYDDDIDVALRTIQRVLEENPMVLKEPAPFLMVEGLADSSVNIVARPWVNNADIGNAISVLTRDVKLGLEKAGCSIPFPQRDIHLIGDGGRGNGGPPERDQGTGEGTRPWDETAPASRGG